MPEPMHPMIEVCPPKAGDVVHVGSGAAQLAPKLPRPG